MSKNLCRVNLCSGLSFLIFVAFLFVVGHDTRCHFLKEALSIPSFLSLQQKDSEGQSIERGLRVLTTRGEILERRIRERILKMLREGNRGEPWFDGHGLFEDQINYPSEANQLTHFFLHDPDGFQMHFHGWGERFAGQMVFNRHGEVSFPLWLEVLEEDSSPTVFDNATRAIFAPISETELPRQFLAHFEEAIGGVLGDQWKQILLQTAISQRYCVVEPLLSNPKHWNLFLELLRSSDVLRKIVGTQRWSARLGTLRYSLESPARLPLVVTGRLRMIMNKENISSAFLYQEKPIAFLSFGLLTIDPNVSFEDNPHLLEQIFIWGAKHSLHMEESLYNGQAWPDEEEILSMNL